MIKNEKQYKISKKTVAELAEQIAGMKADANRDSLKLKLSIASLGSFKKDIEKEIAVYEKLKASKSARLKERSIAELPDMLIEYKIAHQLTHKEFSKILGVKEQQLQRYESEGFKSVSFQNLIKFISKMNIDIRIKETIVKPQQKLQAAHH